MNETTEVQVMRPNEVAPLELIERAQIDTQIATAKKYPRSLAQVKRKMMEFATLDQETAEACFYALPRQGKTIKGPSVRLAEIAASCYQNIKAGARIIDNDGKHVTAQGICIDLENNVSVSIEKQRRITGKDGRAFNDDMQTVTANAASAIAFRDAVFKVIPGALIKPVYEAAMRVAVGDAKTLSDRRARALDSLAKAGVTKERVLLKLGKKNIEEIGLDDLEILFGLFNAIKDGDTTPDEAFTVVAEASNPKNDALERARKAGVYDSALENMTAKQIDDEIEARQAIIASEASENAQDSSQGEKDKDVANAATKRHKARQEPKSGNEGELL